MSRTIRRTASGRGSALGLGLLGAALALTATARAGDFDESGRYLPASGAIAFEDFAAPTTFVPEDLDPACVGQVHYVVQATADALSGAEVIVLDGARDCPASFALEVPAGDRSYQATVWLRHGVLNGEIVVDYPEDSGLQDISVRMAPTGRATSDGWVELSTNSLSVEGDLDPDVYLRASDASDDGRLEVDALELVEEGSFSLQSTCDGLSDPICGSEAVCIYGMCREGRYAVPPLPEGELREQMVESIRARLEMFFGGRKTRLEDLPRALEELDRTLDATTPWQFWNGFGTAIRRLHDWHTSASSSVLAVPLRGRLNACFIEGDADLSHGLFPRDTRYADILVSHVGPDAAGLSSGDRLVAVDGQHPIAWARQLVEIDWGYRVATDADSFADFAEALGGPPWAGGSLILKYASSITVVRCPGGDCEPVETIAVADLAPTQGGADVACDNRPSYHFEEGGPDPATHYVFEDIFRGRIAGTSQDEAVFGMVWDTLYGGGDPNGQVNGALREAVDEWKAGARGVILDHRAGNGGTIDAPEYLTQLVRDQRDIAVLPSGIATAGSSAPATAEEGIELYSSYPTSARFRVGASGHDPELPVAVILHRDGSASDYFPFGMKGASPNVRLFAPHSTAGAFSTFIQFNYWGGLRFQFASGETITDEGEPLIGQGVLPDEIVEQKQSDLVQGKDSLHEAALAWVRENLKPAGDPR